MCVVRVVGWVDVSLFGFRQLLNFNCYCEVKVLLSIYLSYMVVPHFVIQIIEILGIKLKKRYFVIFLAWYTAAQCIGNACQPCI